MPRCPGLLAFGLILGSLGFARAQEPRTSDRQEGLRLLKQGDELADAGKTTEAVIRYKEGFEQILPGLRRIPFRHEVKRDVTAREDMPARLLKDFEEDTTPEELRAGELGMKALGFFPRAFDYKATMIDVLSEEIAAFYDPRTKTMHLIREPEAKDRGKEKGEAGGDAGKPNLLERLLGKPTGFDKDENKTVIAHELTHALADQNYDLDRLLNGVKNDDDRQLAAQALIEGEATLAMLATQAEDWDGSATARFPARQLEFTFNLMMPLLPMGSSKALQDAPALIKESLLFPYLKGVIYCVRATNKGGWEALDALYKNPPLSTEQILHPDKAGDNPDLPVAIDLGELKPGEGWTELGRNVVGEFQLGVLLRKHEGRKAAAGWDGDQYVIFESKGGDLGLVWLTTWDSEDDAREFAGSYARFQGTKIDPENSPDVADPVPARLIRNRRTDSVAIERRGLDVAVVEGFDRPTTEALLERAFVARKAEKVNAPRPTE
ncbi:MAG: hypothetical protein U0800_23420 [Isosphaeraceae bacterium]